MSDYESHYDRGGELHTDSADAHTPRQEGPAMKSKRDQIDTDEKAARQAMERRMTGAHRETTPAPVAKPKATAPAKPRANQDARQRAADDERAARNLMISIMTSGWRRGSR
jgi:hypothetical protein